MNLPGGPLLQILAGDKDGMSTASRHEKANLLLLLNSAQLLGLIQNASEKNIAIARRNRDPHEFRPPVGDPRSAVVDQDLQVVRMLGKKPLF